MALTIVKADEPYVVEHVILEISSDPGLGKSTLAYGAETPVLLDFDGGAFRALGRKDTAPVKNWADVTKMTAKDFEGKKTIVVDTVGRALDYLTRHIIAGNAKMGASGGGLTLQGWGALRSQFNTWLSDLRAFDVDIVLLVHSAEQQSGDVIKQRIDVQGSTKNMIHQSATAIGYIYTDNNIRRIGWDPSDSYFGKNPLGALANVPIPDISVNPSYLADCIAQLKAAINTTTETQAEEAKRVAYLTETINGLNGVDEFNEYREMLLANEANATDKRLLLMVAQERGLRYNRDTSTFVLPEAYSVASQSEPEPEQPPPTEQDLVSGMDDMADKMEQSIPETQTSPANDRLVNLRKFLDFCEMDALSEQYKMYADKDAERNLVAEVAREHGYVWLVDELEFVVAPSTQEALL